MSIYIWHHMWYGNLPKVQYRYEHLNCNPSLCIHAHLRSRLDIRARLVPNSDFFERYAYEKVRLTALGMVEIRLEVR